MYFPALGVLVLPSLGVQMESGSNFVDLALDLDFDDLGFDPAGYTEVFDPSLPPPLSVGLLRDAVDLMEAPAGPETELIGDLDDLEWVLTLVRFDAADLDAVSCDLCDLGSDDLDEMDGDLDDFAAVGGDLDDFVGVRYDLGDLGSDDLAVLNRGDGLVALADSDRDDYGSADLDDLGDVRCDLGDLWLDDLAALKRDDGLVALADSGFDDYGSVDLHVMDCDLGLDDLAVAAPGLDYCGRC